MAIPIDIPIDIPVLQPVESSLQPRSRVFEAGHVIEDPCVEDPGLPAARRGAAGGVPARSFGDQKRHQR